MNHLKETEWLTINKVLLEVHDIATMDIFSNRVLRICRMLIPYTKGYFIIFNEEEKIDKDHSSVIDMDPRIYDLYIDSYYDQDYMKYTMDISNHTITYRDTDIMEENIRCKTEFYCKFLKPNDIPYGAGIVLRRNGKNIGIINFFRNSRLGDFSNKDMFILDVLKEHLSHILSRQLASEKKPVKNQEYNMEKAIRLYGLSKREGEVLKYLLEGLSNAQIAENMNISLSTVKKHVYKIFLKMQINTRAQLYILINQIK